MIEPTSLKPIIEPTFSKETVKPISTEAKALLDYYEQLIAEPEIVELGEASQVSPLYNSETPPLALREYHVEYPPTLIEAYKLACAQYDKTFMTLVGNHAQWETDYQYAPHTFAFQVDGPAYPQAFLDQAAYIDPTVLAEVINARVFEYENNLAMYGLNNRLWPEGTTNQTWHTALETVRQQTGKKIAVLAGTEQKLDEMLLSELAATRESMPDEDFIRAMTGFDMFMGPGDLVAHYDKYQGQDSEYIFFGRTSKPKSWLRNPSCQLHEDMFSHPELLKYVRAYALTHNYDDSTLPFNHPDIITDTKEALVKSGAAYLVTQPHDIYSVQFLDHLKSQGIDMVDIITGTLSQSKRQKIGGLFLNFPSDQMLSTELITHLDSRGVDPQLIAAGNKLTRGKPLKLHYGVYGHITGPVNRAKFLNQLMEQIRMRGHYILQSEFSNLKIVDAQHPTEQYIAIDRVFFVRGQNGELTPMESCRSLMPVNSNDGKKNSVHESAQTRCARIIL